MATTPLALSPALPSELLTYVLTHQAFPTTLIICQRRVDFFNSLLACIPQHIQDQPPPPPEKDQPSAEAESDPNPNPNPLALHHLLIPTLHQVATSQHINVIYLPTVSHLRAYLAVFPPTLGKEPPPRIEKFDKPGRKLSLVVVYGLLELHRDTSEWSAQGLGESLAALVEAGWRCGRKVVLLEERKGDEYDVEPEETIGGNQEDQNQARKKAKVWDERVPMLNGSVKRAGFDSEDGGWSGRTIEVGRILARWFKFVKSDWDTQV